jgi:hypothetical protein
MSRNEVLTYRDVASSTKRIPKGPLREALLQALSGLIAGTLMAVFISGLVYWFRFSLPIAFAVSFFLSWALASLIDRPKKFTQRAWILVLAGIALASYAVMRVGW